MSTTAVEVTAREVMSTPVAAVADSASIWDAWTVVIHDQIRHVAVVNGRHCIGVVSESDLVRAWNLGPEALKATPIRSLLINQPSCVLPDAPLRHVAEIMNTNQVDAVPVVDDTGAVLGMITAGDIVHAVAETGIRVDQDGG